MPGHRQDPFYRLGRSTRSTQGRGPVIGGRWSEGKQERKKGERAALVGKSRQLDAQ